MVLLDKWLIKFILNFTDLVTFLKHQPKQFILMLVIHPYMVNTH
jgi:hypothetical protein